MTKGEISMVAYVYELSAAELAEIEGGSWSWGAVNARPMESVTLNFA
jgi:hypothetical protein